MSRLQSRLRELAKQEHAAETRAELNHHLTESGDAFELAARCAEHAYRVREQRPEESDVFRIGYATACLELAVVLRAMRRGEPPDASAMTAARETALNEAGQSMRGPEQ